MKYINNKFTYNQWYCSWNIFNYYFVYNYFIKLHSSGLPGSQGNTGQPGSAGPIGPSGPTGNSGSPGGIGATGENYTVMG